jgi:alpha-tubulin suppressor-like RCC1 family protein
MSILKIQPDAISNTESFVFGNVTTTSITANGVNLGTAVAEAFVLANNANKTTTSDTAPADPKVGDSWFDTVTNVLLRYTNDGVSNNWIDITGPQNAGFIYQSYALTPNTSTINETTGNTVIYTVATTNTADNTVLYWTTSGTVVAADFSDSVSNGSVTITNNSGTITRRLSADVTTEGSETIVLNLRTGSNTGTIVAVATTVTVEDTSQPPQQALYAWGSAQNGELGLNTSEYTYRSSPTQVGTNTNWNLVSIGKRNAMAIKTDGTLWAWGGGGNSNIGLNDTVLRSSPTQVGTLTNWNLVSAGSYATHAIKLDGTLWTWGNNGLGGNLGTNSGSTSFSSPIQVGTNTNWALVANGHYHNMAIKTDGTLWAWGHSIHGESGLNFTRPVFQGISSPTQVGTGTNWRSVVAETYDQYGSTLATKTDGTLWTWGHNTNSDLGLGNNISRSSPTQIGTGTDWSSQIAKGVYHGLAIKTDGTLWAWGVNSGYGSLGTNNGTDRNSPVQVGTNTNWQKVACSGQVSFAIKTDGTLWAWGRGTSSQGELGINISSGFGVSSPTQIGSSTLWLNISAAYRNAFATNSVV